MGCPPKEFTLLFFEYCKEVILKVNIFVDEEVIGVDELDEGNTSAAARKNKKNNGALS